MFWVEAPVAAGVLPPAESWGESLKLSLLQADVQQLSLTSDLPVKVDKRIWGISHIIAQQIKRATSGHRPSQNEHRLDIFCTQAENSQVFCHIHWNRLFLLWVFVVVAATSPHVENNRLGLAGKRGCSLLTTCHPTGNQPSFKSQSVYKIKPLVGCREACGMSTCFT